MPDLPLVLECHDVSIGEHMMLRWALNSSSTTDGRSLLRIIRCSSPKAHDAYFLLEIIQQVGGVNGGEACMRALGFTVTEPDQASWLLVPSAAAWDVLTTGRAQIQMASATLPASGNASAPAAPRASAGFAAGLGELPPPGMFPGPATFGGGPGGMATGMGGGMPDMGMIQRMAQDPAALQGMMNDPQVQAMMRSNPQMAAAMQVCPPVLVLLV